MSTPSAAVPAPALADLLPAQRSASLPGAVAEALDAVSADPLVGLLQDLLRIPSVTGSDAESEAQHALAGRLTGAGMDVDLWSIDLPSTLASPGFPGLEAPRSEAWGLVGSWGGSSDGTDGPTVVLNGHIDVVPPGDQGWTTTPWSGEVRDGRVLGRGACDMKAGLACQLMAVQALRAAGVRLRGTVLLESVVGEEDGGLGTFATLQRGYRGDLAIICEPTSGALVPACAGALTFRLTVPGRSVHASARLEGVDAIEKYVLVHAALRRLEVRRNRDAHPLMARYSLPYPLSVGTLRAGDWASSVPDLLVAEGRLGVALGEDPADARADLERTVAEVNAGDPWLSANPVQVTWWGGQFAPGYVDPDSAVARLVSDTHTRLHGSRPAVHGAPYGSDQRLLTGLGGVPAVHYGPGDVRKAHAPDESVPVQEMVDVTRTLVLLLATACGVR
ncbi:MAG: acetylornithine deacetylase [Frankiales bacterium]|nr:acetylornithine deacetylase [Frankiales bacterium]